MACRGVLFALTPEEEVGLLKPAGPKQGFFASLFGAHPKPNTDAETLEFLTEYIEQRWDEDWLCETDKAWDAIHRCLSDGTLDPRPGQPLDEVILGGKSLYSGGDYIISYKPASNVRRIAEAVALISDDQLGGRYDALDEDEYGFPKSAEDRQYTVQWFSGVREFYQKAAAAGRPVVFSVDQ